MKTNFKKIAMDGVITSNPTLKLVLGTCPTLALTTLAMNGIGMGAAVTFVLICSNVFVSLLRNVIPDKVRIPAFVLIIATFVTIVRLVLDKFLPTIYESLGLYLPLIVVNCIILARAESFASKNGVLASAADGADDHGRVPRNTRRGLDIRRSSLGLQNRILCKERGRVLHLRHVYRGIRFCFLSAS